ncbi:hypothetical protein TPAR_01932, partial [Tolypocladium paradoxum]
TTDYTGVKAFGLNAPLPRYGVHILEWDVEVFPGNPRMNFSGTIQQVEAQINKVNPQWYITYIQRASEEGSKSLDKRASFYQTDCVGGPNNWKVARTDAILDGIGYLRGVDGRPLSGPGPGMCARVSCSYRSAIWWCNDNGHPYELGSFGDIADGAQAIVDKCSKPTSHAPDPGLVGQAFSEGKWNVVVRFDNDSC